MEKAASFLSSLLGGGDGEVHPHIPHQVLQGHPRAPGPHHRHWVQVGSPVGGGERQRLSLHPEGGAQARARRGRVAAGSLRRGLAAHMGLQLLLPVTHFAKVECNCTTVELKRIKLMRKGGQKLQLVSLCHCSCYQSTWNGAEWFSTYFGKPSRLVRFKEETRPTDPDYAQGYKIMFTDCFPFLIASQGSLDALNEILKEPVPMNRFRPNILVDGCHPYSEDLWKTIKINNLTFVGVKLCSRCKVPTINQDNGIPGTEPTETLLAFRSDEVLRPSHKNKRQAYFGQNLVCKESLSAKGKGKIIKVGNPVNVLQAFASSNEVPA